MHECICIHVFWNKQSTLKGSHEWKPRAHCTELRQSRVCRLVQFWRQRCCQLALFSRMFQHPALLGAMILGCRLWEPFSVDCLFQNTCIHIHSCIYTYHIHTPYMSPGLPQRPRAQGCRTGPGSGPKAALGVFSHPEYANLVGECVCAPHLPHHAICEAPSASEAQDEAPLRVFPGLTGIFRGPPLRRLPVGSH